MKPSKQDYSLAIVSAFGAYGFGETPVSAMTWRVMNEGSRSQYTIVRVTYADGRWELQGAPNEPSKVVEAGPKGTQPKLGAKQEIVTTDATGEDAGTGIATSRPSTWLDQATTLPVLGAVANKRLALGGTAVGLALFAFGMSRSKYGRGSK